MKKAFHIFIVVLFIFNGYINSYAAISDLSNSSSYAKSAIISLEQKNILTGDESGKYYPKAPIIRSELIKMLVLALGNIDASKYQYTDYKVFTDISPYTYNTSSKNYKYIMAAYYNDIISGTPQKTFRPNNNITREELAVIFNNILVPIECRNRGVTLVNSARFKDKGIISTWARSSVELMISTGLMVGISYNAFDPKGLVSKEQAAVIINKFITQKSSIYSGMFNSINPNFNEIKLYALKNVKTSIDGTKSILGNTDIISNTWNIVSKPVGSDSTLDTQYSLKPYFIPDKTGQYVIMQTASNGYKVNTAKFIITVKELSNSTDDIDLSPYKTTRKNHLDLNIRTVVPLSDGWFIAGDVINNKIIIANAITGAIGNEYPIEFMPTKVQYIPEKNIIIACQAWEGNRSNGKLPPKKIVKIDVSTGKISYISTSYRVRTLTFGEDNIVFAFTADMSYEPVIGTSREHIAIIDIDNEKLIAEQDISSDEDIYFMGYDKNNNNLFLGEEGISSSSLYRFSFDQQNNTLEKKQMIWDAAPYARDFAISEDGKHIAFISATGNEYNETAERQDNWRIYDIDSSDIEKNNDSWGTWPGGSSSADFSQDNKFISIASAKEILIFDVITKLQVNKITIPFDSYANNILVRYSKGGKLIFHIYGDKIYYHI